MAKDKAKPAKKSDKPDTPTRVEITTANNKARILESLAKNDGLIYLSCQAAGVHPSTYYDYLDKDPVFADAVKNVTAIEVDKVESGLIKLMKCGDAKVELGARKCYLDAHGKDRGYGTERKDLNHTGTMNINSTIQDVRFELPENHTGPGSVGPLPPGWEAATGGSLPG